LLLFAARVAQGVLSAMGKNIVHCGDAGAGGMQPAAVAPFIV
jgi:hypothetical protein